MKLKGKYFFTLRENTKDEESVSGNLLVRAGFTKKVGAGIYMYLPMGFKALDNVMKIVKEEMDNAGAQEMLMPSLIPSEYYEKCGRVEAFGKGMFNLHDRWNHHMVLGPTHEELFAIAAKSCVRSYKDLPFTLYQQADKFRDEIRPRYGVLRVREFIMKDSYTFDADEESQEKSYMAMFNAYKKIFDRMDINYKIVKASVGAMGGTLSEEFQALSDIGEDILVLCDKCDYATNLEIATRKFEKSKEEKKQQEKFYTPNAHTVEEVCRQTNTDVKNTVKALLMNVNDKLTIFFLRGDRELNEEKACKLLGCSEINFADDALIATSNAVAGYTGPIGLKGANIVVDDEVLAMRNFLCGANDEGYHLINANPEDIKYDIKGDISNVVEGDICPNCGGTLKFQKGIEIGNTFKLGTHYAEELGLTYLDENNKECVPTMGSYGIGPARVLAAIIEQNHDDKGMILPMNVAPYKVAIVLLSKDEESIKYANKLHDDLIKNGIDTLLDDRDERPGVKFNDMDLIGIPLRITIGKKFSDGNIELKLRIEENSKDIKTSDALKEIKKIVKENTK